METTGILVRRTCGEEICKGTFVMCIEYEYLCIHVNVHQRAFIVEDSFKYQMERTA